MAKKAWIVGSVSLIAMSLVLIGCGDEEQEAQNSPPAISSLTASRDTVDPTARVSISCNATDSDHDSLSFNWCASGGEILGSGSQVEWEAPIWAGLYWIKAEVTDGQAIVSDSLSIWVNEGFLLVKTRSEVLKVTLDGTSSLFYQSGGEIEVLGKRIFIGPSGNTLELDLGGHEVRRITRPSQIPWATTFVVLPDPGFAFVNNQNDSIYFMSSDGAFLASRQIVLPSPTSLQSTKGITIGDTLFMADTQVYGVVAYDLSTNEGWVFRSFQSQSVSPTDVDCAMESSTFRICQST